MAEMSVAEASTNGGYNFQRSDGMKFFSVYHDDGSIVLYVGMDRDRPPQTAVIGLDANISNKVDDCKRWILSYPNKPE